MHDTACCSFVNVQALDFAFVESFERPEGGVAMPANADVLLLQHAPCNRTPPGAPMPTGVQCSSSSLQ